MNTTRLKYTARRVLAGTLCVGILFTSVGEGKLVSGATKESSLTAKIMSSQNYVTSRLGIDEIKKSEGIVLDSEGMVRAYDDMQPYVILQENTKIKGTITIGYGHTGNVNGVPLTWETRMTTDEAEALLRSDIIKYENAVNSFCETNGVVLTQYQFDALVCFTYNLGTEWTKKDSTKTIARMLRNGYTNYTADDVINIFSLYKYSGGILLPGLVQRRRREAAMFLNDESLVAYKVGNYKVDTTSLSVRSTASLTSSELGTLSKGVIEKVTQISGSWGKCSSGWINLDYCCYVTDADLQNQNTDETAVSGNTSDGTDKGNLEQTTDKEENTSKDDSVTEGDNSGGKEEDESLPQKTEADYPTGFYRVTTPLNIRSGPGKEYSVAGYTNVGDIFNIKETYGKWGKVAKGWISLDAKYSEVYKPEKPVINARKNIASGISLAWAKIEEADGYFVYCKTGKDGYKKIKTISGSDSTSYTDGTAVSGTLYQYKIVAYRKIDGGVCRSTSSSVKKIVRLNGTEIAKVNSPKAGNLDVNWTKDTLADGYEIQYSLSSKFVSTERKSVVIETNKSSNKRISGLTRWKKYYVRIRAYKTVDGVKSYSAWSKKVSVKIG